MVQTNPNRPSAAAPQPVTIHFGGGLNTRKLAEQIDDTECADGSNFALDLGSSAFSPRKAFDLVGSAPNGAAISGFAQLVNADGTTSTLIQSGGDVYKWDGTTSGFTSVGTVAAGAKLRGKLEHNYDALGYVLVTDLELQQPVMTWDGTSFTELPTNLGETFFARYADVVAQRAVFANVIAGTAIPHMLTFSKIGEPGHLTFDAGDELTDSVGNDVAFWVLTPDMSPVTGLCHAFNVLAIPTVKGSLFGFSGSSPSDFALASQFPFLGVSGDEAIAAMGNDIVGGVNGRLLSLGYIQTNGQIEQSDLGAHIANRITDVSGWTLVYDKRLYRLYCFPDGKQECWVLHKSISDAGSRQYVPSKLSTVSPWSRWTTAHAIGFAPSCVWTMKRPSDGLLMVYMGDSSGHIYQMEGSGSLDGGTAAITASRLSRLYGAPDGTLFDVSGSVHYQNRFTASLSLNIEYAGDELNDQSIDISLAALEASAVYGGSLYWGGANYYGRRFNSRLRRHSFALAGASSHLQARATVIGPDYAIDEIVFSLASQPA